MSVRSLPIVLSARRRPALLLIVILVALSVGVLGGVGAAKLRTAALPLVKVAQGSVSGSTMSGIQVPADAVVVENGQQVVYVVVDGLVIRQPVTATSDPSSGVDIVTSGLSAHATVVISPSGLHDGEKVRTP